MPAAPTDRIYNILTLKRERTEEKNVVVRRAAAACFFLFRDLLDLALPARVLAQEGKTVDALG